jgi:hypothetical protein
MLLRGGRPLVNTTNKEIVTSLREVAAGEIKLSARETAG